MTKGVLPGWKILMIDGEEMTDEGRIRPMLQKKSRVGKKYHVIFSKTAKEMTADIATANAADVKRKADFEKTRSGVTLALTGRPI